jgi:predicted metal-dependent phosphoesterase TrpH
MVDLHIHTTCSDGAMSPVEVVDTALARGIRAVAITDHDTIEGNGEAVAAGQERGLPVVPGVEISTEWEGLTFHLLGYGMNRVTARVQEAFAFLVESRQQRNPKMVEKLRRLGIDLTLDEVAREANGSVVGRPHFAQVLRKKGAVRSLQEAFDRYLGRGAPAYADKKRLPPAAACSLIEEAGGLSVLAHPGLVGKERLPGLLQYLYSLGLAGIEAYYSRHTPGQVAHYLRLARDHGLVATGGSDFHRAGEGGPEMGCGFGNLRVPYGCFEALQERLEQTTAKPPSGTRSAG